MADERIQYAVADGVATVTFNRADKRNALTAAMYVSLRDALLRAQQDTAVRALVFTGHGGHFCAGNDLGDFLSAPDLREEGPILQFLLALVAFDKPMLAAVEGVAVGIGTTLLLHCDFAFAAHTARFQLPFVNLGLCPEAASSVLLARAAGPKRARELLMLGEMFDAETALESGLLTRLTEPGEALDVAVHVAAQLAKKPPTALRATRRLLREGDYTEAAAAVSAEGAVFADLLQREEAKEAFTAFFEKRPADFSRFS